MITSKPINHDKFLNKLISNPKRVFLLDGMGAVLTCVLLSFVLSPFNHFIGLPNQIFLLLSLIALIFAGYSLTCFAFFRNRTSKLLLPIIVANSLYCVLTFALLLYYHETITFLGISYFIGEIIILGLLICLEFKTWSKHA